MTYFSSLDWAMECPELGIIMNCSKDLFLHYVYILLAKNTQSKLSLLNKICNKNGYEWTID